ncbi:MAG: phosphatidate cytidylyltransferase [Sphingobacteriales bacterium]|nr:phosphatidate cytidylyltransferase [Sphingobacteriales bacterium]
MSSFTQRAITAVGFLVVMITGIYISSYSLFALFGLISFLGVWEYQTLVALYPFNQHTALLRDKWILSVMGLLVYALIGLVSMHLLPLWVLLFILPIIFLLFIKELFDAKSPNPFVRVSLNITGLLYLVVPLALINTIANESNTFEPNRIMGMLLLIWANDTGAYVLGSKIGKTPFFKRISPKKTWEGTISGMITTLILAAILGFVFKELSVVQWYGVAVCVIIFSTLGDLVESMLKRNLGIKDSGTILPGHGGILDRFDALLLVVPYIALWILMT